MDQLFLDLAFIFPPQMMKGVNAIETKPTFQLKIKEITTPLKTEQNYSLITATASVLAPFKS